MMCPIPTRCDWRWSAREARQDNPPVLAQLCERARQLDVTVRPHALNSYDQLSTHEDADDDHGGNGVGGGQIP